MAKYCILALPNDEQISLTALVQQRRIAGKRLVRAQCLLAMATNGLGWTDQQTAQACAVSTRTLGRLRQRACEGASRLPFPTPAIPESAPFRKW